MISITPQGQVYLCKTPLENDYKNQLTFSDATAQQTYFTSKIYRNLGDDDYTYIKKDNVIKVGLPIDNIIECNYLFYKNKGFTNKIYYCFITDMEYINENCTAVTIETDVYQTYMFDIVKKACFVEREHTNDDTLGKNTVPERLDTGEFVINEYEPFDEYANDYLIVVGTTKLPKEITQSIIANLPTKVYNGIFSGLYYIALRSVNDATKFLMVMDGQGIGDSVYDVFIIPKSIVTISNNQWQNIDMDLIIGIDSWTYSGTANVWYKIIPNSQTEAVMVNKQTITRNTTLNGYTPKNNKMFTGEFNYMYVTNNAGQDIKYNYEDFYNNTPIFSLKGAITPGCSIRLVPQNYKNYEQGSGEDDICNPYGLTGAKYPVCSWTSDSYTNWLTQQGINIEANSLGNAVTTIGSTVAGGVGSAGIGLAGGIAELMDVDTTLSDKRAYLPIHAKGNVNSGDVTYAMGKNQFILYKMSCRYEYAKRIDDYLSMFGYRTNDVKIPNLTGRTNWNYVKTKGCNFEGDIPQIYLNKIKEIFDKGITLWHNANTMYDYSQSNNIVS